MTRQEAIKTLKEAMYFIDGLGARAISSKMAEAIATLETCTVEPSKSARLGENGLLPCGCGGRVSIAFYPGWTGTFDLYHVDCFSCHVGTRPCQTAEQAKAAWNAAMGWRADE